MKTAANQISEACEQTGVSGGACYFELETLEIGAKLGLDGLEFCFIGRDGVLGDVEAAVISGALGYFNPRLVDETWPAGRARMGPRDGARAYASACHALGRARLSDAPGIDRFCDALTTVNNAADARGLPLYAAHRAEPVPDGPGARAMHLMAVLREYRGPAHLIALTSLRVDLKIAHFLRRPYDMELFGWDEEALDVTDEHRRRLTQADELTGVLVADAYGSLDTGQWAALLDGLSAVGEAF